MRQFLPAALAAVVIFASSVAAHEFKAGDLAIGHPYAFATAPTAQTAAGYFTVTNGGSAPDRLVGVEAAFPSVQVHTTEVDAQGVARMREVEAIELPPGETVTLAPQGMHVMFMGLAAPWTEGETIPVTLVFERAGSVAVEFNVEARGPGAVDHSQMGH